MTKAIAIKPLDEDNARAFVESIKKRVGDIREMLIELHDRLGWEALGYKSWEACIKEEFGWDRRYADRQLSAGRIQKQLPPPTGQSIGPIGPRPILESHLRPLALLPEDQQIAAYTDAKEEAEAAGETLTAAAVKAKADLYKAADEPYVEPEEPPEEEEAPEPTVEELMAASNKALESLARQITGAHKLATELETPHVDEERLGILQSQLRTAAGTLRAAKGDSTCSYCEGSGRRSGKKCKPCMGCGWLTKTMAESAPQND